MKTREEYRKIYFWQKIETVAVLVITLVAIAAVLLSGMIWLDRAIERHVADAIGAYIPPEPEAVETPESGDAPEPAETVYLTAEPEIVEPAARYELTDAERAVVEQVVMAESGAEPYEGQVAVAQCILNACERDGIRPDAAVVEYGYTSRRIEPNESVCRAVAAVFDGGETVTEEEILYFYAPSIVSSAWHESQDFVLEIAGHRFFAEVEA